MQEGQRFHWLQMTPYFLRFLAILRSEEGRPLLNKVAESTDRLEVLLAPCATGAPGAARLRQGSPYYADAAYICSCTSEI